jgi:hypothetical protein
MGANASKERLRRNKASDFCQKMSGGKSNTLKRCSYVKDLLISSFGAKHLPCGLDVKKDQIANL